MGDVRSRIDFFCFKLVITCSQNPALVALRLLINVPSRLWNSG
nr:hypothetical protein [Haliscomenobacter sp.]